MSKLEHIYKSLLKWQKHIKEYEVLCAYIANGHEIENEDKKFISLHGTKSLELLNIIKEIINVPVCIANSKLDNYEECKFILIYNCGSNKNDYDDIVYYSSGNKSLKDDLSDFYNLTKHIIVIFNDRSKIPHEILENEILINVN